MNGSTFMKQITGYTQEKEGHTQTLPENILKKRHRSEKDQVGLLPE